MLKETAFLGSRGEDGGFVANTPLQWIAKTRWASNGEWANRLHER
jgi:hypothetical protein